MDGRMKHTPEPWEIMEVGDINKHLCPVKDNVSILTVSTEYLGSKDDEPTFFGSVYNPEDARRIVACVNACAGIETETLESVANTKSPSPLAAALTLCFQRDHATTQRDKLLAACKALLNPACNSDVSYDMAIKAIKEVEEV